MSIDNPELFNPLKVGGNFAEDGKNLKPIFGRVGSKLSSIKDIISIIPPHTTYVEPFIGGASIFWNKDPATKSVINDLDKEFVDGYKILKQIPITTDLTYIDNIPLKELQLKVDSINDKSSLADRLLKVYKKSKGTFNQKSIGKLYKNVPIEPVIKHLQEYKKLLKKTTILNQDYLTVIKKYDSPTTFFFLDPPYEKKGKTLYNNYAINYEEMNNVLKNLKGKFLLTINDSKYISDIFKGFNQKKMNTSNIGNSPFFNSKERKELFISNYNMKKGGSVETDRFDENGIVSLPEFRSVKINLPTYMYKIQPYIKGKPPPYRYKLVIPITSSRNISSRKKETSLIINQKPISNPTFDIENSIEGGVEPRLDEFSPADRRKIQTYYNKVKENERLNPNQVDKDDYEIIPRGRPLPCEGANNRKAEPKKSKNLVKEVKHLTKEPKKLTKESSFLENLQEQLKDKPKQTNKLEVVARREDIYGRELTEQRKDKTYRINIGKERNVKIISIEKYNEDEDNEPLYLLNDIDDNLYISESNFELKDRPYKYTAEITGDEITLTGVLVYDEDEDDEDEVGWIYINSNDLPSLSEMFYREGALKLQKELLYVGEEEKKEGKGLLSKNKILSNNKKMGNPWIEYVKSYAAKNGMSYRDALRCPKCKAGYKKGGKVGMGVVDEIGNQDLLAEMYNDSELGANAGKKYISL